MIFGPLSLWGTTLGLAGLVVASLVASVRAARRDAERPPPSLFPWLMAAGAFALVCGATWLTVDKFSSSHPFWDQWVEAHGLYKPWASHSLGWWRIFEAHNEHRIAVSRIWALLIFIADGQWDNRTQAALNALLHALPAGFLVACYAIKLRPLELIPVALFVVVPWALPLAWENVPYGFQSQFYFLLIYGPLSLWLIAHHDAGEPGFWLGVMCAVVALFTVGSGPLCAIAIAATVAAESVLTRAISRGRLLLITIAVALAIAGVLSRVEVPDHRVLQARSVGELLHATACFGAFPFIKRPLFAFLIWSPVLAWSGTLLRQRKPWSRDQRFVAAFACFALLHIVGIAWARGGFNLDPSSRYFDVLALGLQANAIAAVLLARRWHGRLALVGVAAWVVIAAWGLPKRANQSTGEHLPGVAERAVEQAHHVRRYLQTGNFDYLKAAPLFKVPFPKPDFLRAVLDDPFVPPILPWNIRSPLQTRVLEGGDAAADLPDAPRQAFTVGKGARIEVAASRLPKLRFAFTGDAVPGREKLTIVDASGHGASVNLPPPPGRAWADGVTGPAPKGAFTLVAETSSPGASWGFTAPVEVGRLSAWTDHLGRGGRALLIVGATCWIAAAVFQNRKRKSS